MLAGDDMVWLMLDEGNIIGETAILTAVGGASNHLCPKHRIYALTHTRNIPRSVVRLEEPVTESV